jgi:hypothetical protein
VCESYLKNHGDTQAVCMKVPEKNEKRNNVSVCVCVCVCVCVWEREREREREREISKQKVLCWNPIVCIHMVPRPELTLGICVRDIVILWDISGGGWAELKGWACSTERACVFLCERLVGHGRKWILTLTEGEKYTKCACVIPMPMEKWDMYACERDCAIHSCITI